MKKIILIFILFSGMSGFSQQNETRNSEGTTEEMATVRAKRLALQLDLTEEQQNKLKDHFAKRIKEEQDLMQKRRETGEKLSEVEEEISQKHKNGLKSILTPEQFTKWEQLQEKRRKGRNRPVRKN